MENRGPVFEKSNSVENVYHLRLTALLRELVRDGGFKGAAQALDIDQRTVARSFRSGALSRGSAPRWSGGCKRERARLWRCSGSATTVWRDG